MFNNKKGRIMRHPYASLMVISLATVGALTITKRTKEFFQSKTDSVSRMIRCSKKEEM